MRLYLCGVRGSTPAPGAEFLRYGGHTSCVAIAPDGAARPALVLDAGTGLRQVTPLLRGQPFDGTILLTHLHWDHVHGLPFFTAATATTRASPCCCPSRRTGRARRRRWPGACRRRTSRSRRAACAATGPSGRSRPGRCKAEGFTVEAREIPHKGGADARLPGQRRVLGDRLHARSLPHRPRPGTGRVGRVPPGRARACQRRRTCCCTTRSCWPAEVAAEASFGHAAADYAVGLGERAGRRRVMLTHHKPGRTDRGARPARRPVSPAGVRQCHRGRGGRDR